MRWDFIILIAASGTAGLALGPVISGRSRRFILVGGIEAALLGGALNWLPTRGVELPVDPGTAQLVSLPLLAAAAVLLPFWAGAAWSGP